jgi:hypothetical protein
MDAHERKAAARLAFIGLAGCRRDEQQARMMAVRQSIAPLAVLTAADEKHGHLQHGFHITRNGIASGPPVSVKPRKSR